MISVNAVTVTFSGSNLFDNLSLEINPRDRIGLVGRNGAGKSTFLKVILGQQPTTSGSVSFSGDCTIGYLAQEMDFSDTRTIYDETKEAFSELLSLERELGDITSQIGLREDYDSPEYNRLLVRLGEVNDRITILDGGNMASKIERTLMGLGFKRESFTQMTSELSGGWRMRIELAKILLSSPSVLLLDEPTNHLDIESITWLENYLKEYSGAVVLISHDRMFLDNVTNRTVEISLGKATDYKVSYSHYETLRSERREQQVAAYENQQKMIQSTEDFIERFRYKATKSNQVQSRIKQLEKIDRVEIEQEDLSAINIKFPPAPRSGAVAVEAKGAAKSFGSKLVFKDADIIIERGQKVALVGRNGEGKTTFVRMATSQIDPSEGTIKLGHNVEYGYYAQNQEDLLSGDMTVFDTLDSVAVGDIRTKLRDILAAFLFRGEDIDKKVKVLSGGERARLAMARLMLKPYNLLILDEPTNHMDMRSKDILKQAIGEYDGTVILISHDREFLDGIVDKIYEFRDGRVKEHLGGIREFMERRNLENMQQLELSVRQAKQESQTKEVSSGKLSYEQNKERERARRKIESQITKLETLIAESESKLAAIEQELSGDLTPEQVMQKSEEYEKLEAHLTSSLEQWEELNIKLEE